MRTPATTPPSAPIRVFLAAATSALVATLMMAPGCSSDRTTVPNTAIAPSTSSTIQVAPGSTLPSQPDEPMTLFEKRRLIARIQEDPRTIQRLSPRERRELAGMVKAMEENKQKQ